MIARERNMMAADADNIEKEAPGEAGGRTRRGLQFFRGDQDFNREEWGGQVVRASLDGGPKYLLLCAAQLADSQGCLSVSIARLARLLSVSRPTAYEYLAGALESGWMVEIEDDTRAWRLGAPVWLLVQPEEGGAM